MVFSPKIIRLGSAACRSHAPQLPGFQQAAWREKSRASSLLASKPRSVGLQTLAIFDGGTKYDAHFQFHAKWNYCFSGICEFRNLWPEEVALHFPSISFISEVVQRVVACLCGPADSISALSLDLAADNPRVPHRTGRLHPQSVLPDSGRNRHPIQSLIRPRAALHSANDLFVLLRADLGTHHLRARQGAGKILATWYVSLSKLTFTVAICKCHQISWKEVSHKLERELKELVIRNWRDL